MYEYTKTVKQYSVDICAKNNGTIIGSVSLFKRSRKDALLREYINSRYAPIYIAGLKVSPDHRRRGIARNLIKMAKDTYKNNELFLECWEDNKIALELYKSEGFKIVGKCKLCPSLLMKFSKTI